MKQFRKYRRETPVNLTADVFTTGELTAILRMSPKTVCDLIDRGKLVGWTIPGTRTRRVSRAALLAFLRENRIDFILNELTDANSVLLAGVAVPTEQRLRDLLPDTPLRVAHSLFDLGFALHAPPYVAVVDVALGGREEVRRAVSKLVEDCRRVILLLPEDAPGVLWDAYPGTTLLQHPVDVSVLVGVIQKGGEL